MWTTEATTEARGSADVVWAAWEDVAHWHDWHPMILESSLSGPFATGSRGFVTPTKGRRGAFVLTAVEPGRHWSSRATMPGGALDFSYTLTPSATGTLITMRATISGPLGFLYRRIIGPLCEAGLPAAVKNLQALAERAPVAP